VALDKEYEGDLYLRGTRPRFPSEMMDEAILQMEAGNHPVAALLVQMADVQCDVNRDYAYRNKSARSGG
jgi:hypothetical protein